MRIIFFGSDDFAAVNLKRLLDDKFEVCACVTQPDRPQGRGMKVMSSPIKQIAEQYRIPVLQPEDLKAEDFLRTLKAYDADLFVVIAYGKFLTSKILAMPKIFSINVHGSLLPKYRGAAPVNWAIIHGDKETGYTIMKMNPKMDAGDMIYQERMTIAPEDTSQTLRERMAKLSSGGLSRTIKAIINNKITLTAQDDSQVTFAVKLSKELGLVDWNKPAQEIHNLVRGLLPWPTAYTLFQGKTLKILKTAVVSEPLPVQPGKVLQIDDEGIFVSCGKDAIILMQVHPESGKPMSGQSFSSGRGLKEGNFLGA